jgi:parallel beta-helix repeat protein
VRRLALLVILPFTLVSAIQDSGAYYVDGLNGNDSNSGTSSAPWQTIPKASDTVGPGSVVTVRAGTYNEHVKVTRSGSSGALTTFQAEGAVVMQGFTIIADYVRVMGFEITNSNTTVGDGNGVAVQGSFNEIRNNYIHDLIFGEGIWLYGGSNRDVSFTSNNIVSGNRIERARIAGILVEGMNSLIENNDISNTIQNPPGAPSRDNPDADGIRFLVQDISSVATTSTTSPWILRETSVHILMASRPGGLVRMSLSSGMWCGRPKVRTRAQSLRAWFNR